MIAIRDSQMGDAEAIAKLMAELSYPTSSDEMAERLRKIENEPNYKTLVATEGDEIVGMIGMAKNLYWEQNGLYVRIQALIVKQTHRRKGVGQLLIEACESWAKEQSAHTILLNCSNREERRAAHQFYPSLGFKAKSTGYVKQL